MCPLPEKYISNMQFIVVPPGFVFRAMCNSEEMGTINSVIVVPHAWRARAGKTASRKQTERKRKTSGSALRLGVTLSTFGVPTVLPSVFLGRDGHFNVEMDMARLQTDSL